VFPQQTKDLTMRGDAHAKAFKLLKYSYFRNIRTPTTAAIAPSDRLPIAQARGPHTGEPGAILAKLMPRSCSKLP
jgi:hypothetical protein